MVHVKKGELTQEEKELLEVIGKGVGAGLRRRRCRSGQGASRSPGAPLAPPALGCGSARLAARDREIPALPLVWDRSRGRRGGEGEALLRRERRLSNSSSKSALERCTFLGPISDYNGRPRGATPPRLCVQHSSGDFAHGPSWRQ